MTDNCVEPSFVAGIATCAMPAEAGPACIVNGSASGTGGPDGAVETAPTAASSTIPDNESPSTEPIDSAITTARAIRDDFKTELSSAFVSGCQTGIRLRQACGVLSKKSRRAGRERSGRREMHDSVDDPRHNVHPIRAISFEGSHTHSSGQAADCVHDDVMAWQPGSTESNARAPKRMHHGLTEPAGDCEVTFLFHPGVSVPGMLVRPKAK